MRMRDEKNGLSLFLILLSGLVIGGFIGHYLGEIPFVRWLAYGSDFGISEPMGIELGIIKLQFGLLLRINVAGVIGLLLGLLLYKRTI